MRGVRTNTRPMNTLAPRTNGAAIVEASSFEDAIMSTTIQNMITSAIPDERAKARFIANIISIVSASEQLQACDPKSIISSALRGVGMGLIPGHGFYVSPYGSVATFTIGYKGYIGLAMSSGYYADIDCRDVREGEYAGRDPRTGKPMVDFSVYDTETERNKHQIIGYYAYFELKDGFFKSEFWTLDQILNHAHTYSNIDIDKWQRIREGKEPVPKGKPWYDANGRGFERMAMKTPLRSLLNSGYAPLSDEMRLAIKQDMGDMQIPFDATNSTSGGQSLSAMAKAMTVRDTVVEDDDVVVDADGVIVENGDSTENATIVATENNFSSEPNNSSRKNKKSSQYSTTVAEGAQMALSDLAEQ